jgi:hypothetical protein
LGSSTLRLIVPSARENEMHTESETLRNKALAHSEFAYYLTSVNRTTRVISSKPFSLLTQQFDLDGLAKLLIKLGKHVMRRELQTLPADKTR